MAIACHLTMIPRTFSTTSSVQTAFARKCGSLSIRNRKSVLLDTTAGVASLKTFQAQKTVLKPGARKDVLEWFLWPTIKLRGIYASIEKAINLYKSRKRR